MLGHSRHQGDAWLRRDIRQQHESSVRYVVHESYYYGHDHGPIHGGREGSRVVAAGGAKGEPRRVKASEFKATCLRLMDEVDESGGEIIITKNGRPVARLTAFHERPRSLFGIDRGKLTIMGDIMSPIDVEWDAEVDPDRVLNP